MGTVSENYRFFQIVYLPLKLYQKGAYKRGGPLRISLLMQSRAITVAILSLPFAIVIQPSVLIFCREETKDTDKEPHCYQDGKASL